MAGLYGNIFTCLAIFFLVILNFYIVGKNQIHFPISQNWRHKNNISNPLHKKLAPVYSLFVYWIPNREQKTWQHTRASKNEYKELTLSRQVARHCATLRGLPTSWAAPIKTLIQNVKMTKQITDRPRRAIIIATKKKNPQIKMKSLNKHKSLSKTKHKT